MAEYQDSSSKNVCPWWRHQMETFSALLALCAGNSPVAVNSPHKGQWRGALMFSLICAWINDWVNNPEAGDLRRHRGHYDVMVMRSTRPFISRFCACPGKLWCPYTITYLLSNSDLIIWVNSAIQDPPNQLSAVDNSPFSPVNRSPKSEVPASCIRLVFI